MSNSGEKAFYLTTPIYYVNDAPHIGHAYTTVAGDVLTRWHRQRGESVWFLTGTDEHGQKVMRTAQQNDTSPQAWVDNLVESAWKPNWHSLNIANDDFIRTTEVRHTERVQRFLQGLKDAGHIYAGKYEGPYCVGCEEFKLPGDLIDDKGEKLCPVHSKPVEIVNENNWFFRLSAFVEPLLEHYRRNPEACQPESARNEVLSFLEGGVSDLSISRSTFDWGIPVPWDRDQVVYVWFDALLNYATAVGLGDDPSSEGGKKFAQTWPADVHLVGKDILRFHAVIWPAMLMAAGLAVPKKVFAHGWLLVGGEKMSKSKLTGIAPSEITDHFGVDAFRYYFLRAIPFGTDGSFSWEDMSARYTSELANDFGNLASRLAAMVEKYCAGVLPAPSNDPGLESFLTATVEKADAAICALDFQGGINAIMEFCKRVNGYVTEKQPWVLAKDPANQSELESVLYNTAESLRALAVLLNPVMPATCEILWQSLGAEKVLGAIGNQEIGKVSTWGQLPEGAIVQKSAVLFPRLEVGE
ncbi:MAG: methionine--tRNA ligase [Actinobacteria bacterium]|uniref:methionine--tRNA ligase n=1 Tax=freshwater metagenome TaxID=449393 RepID=A0A6J6SYH0_9ZZZZ|nr:methionine--tRNA ligase [Actinomycetota bacterium]MSX24206.1 methionine--tRNA ligase [Actinomycetota bacterium]MSY56735.1 methionine--tRNA ligase [Actinomycetota bacterium]MTB00340.1 methionine--tRNA ligase [Actinomycetota bacterium]